MKTDFFINCKNSGEVRDRYDELSRVFNPTDSKEPNEMMNTINAEYDMLMIVFRDAMLDEAVKEKEKVKEKLTVSEKIKELQEKIDPSGLHLEICGTWLWITGKTYQVKDTLKELGFRYSSNKLSWYYRQEDHRSPNQEPIPLEMIREKYGTSVVAMKKLKKEVFMLPFFSYSQFLVTTFMYCRYNSCKLKYIV